MPASDAAPEPLPLRDGNLSMAISNAVVQLMREKTGRGPTGARTIVQDDVVLVLLEQVLTRAETNLVAGGRSDPVLDLRDTIQDSMSQELVQAIQRLTGRTVRAFMSANHADPDLAAEIFMLEPRGVEALQAGRRRQVSR